MAIASRKGKPNVTAQTKAKVILEKINNPDITTREIEEKVGVDHSTAARILQKDLPELATSSDRVKKIVENDLGAVDAMAELAKIFSEQALEMAKASKANMEKIDKGEVLAVNTVAGDSFKRSQLLQGKATSKAEIDIGNIKEAKDEELVAAIFANVKE